MAVVVSLTEQRAYVYRNGVLEAVTTVSTGKPGHETPTGVFTILQKDKNHHSSTYNNAPMPYQQRLTWDGVALHAGGLPGYPESHGCVHLPTGFAQRLFEASNMGMTVVVAEGQVSAPELVHPGMTSPINPMTGAEEQALQLGPAQAFRWEPEKASGGGPLSMVMSTSDRRLFVYRDGAEIGRARLQFRGQPPRAGTHAYIVASGGEPGKMPPWIRIGVPGHADEDGVAVSAQELQHLVLPQDFVARLMPLLLPGTVLVQTGAHVLPQTTGVPVQVLDAQPPEL